MSVQCNTGGLTPVGLMAKKILVASGTQTAAGVDVKDFIGDLDVIIKSESDNGDGGASMTFTLLDSTDNTSFATFSGAPTPVTVTAASAINTMALDTRQCKRYVQLRALTSSTTATYVVGAVGVGVKQIQ